jgi:hypothetical protein
MTPNIQQGARPHRADPQASHQRLPHTTSKGAHRKPESSGLNSCLANVPREWQSRLQRPQSAQRGGRLCLPSALLLRISPRTSAIRLTCLIPPLITSAELRRREPRDHPVRMWQSGGGRSKSSRIPDCVLGWLQPQTRSGRTSDLCPVIRSSAVTTTRLGIWFNPTARRADICCDGETAIASGGQDGTRDGMHVTDASVRWSDVQAKRGSRARS